MIKYSFLAAALLVCHVSTIPAQDEGMVCGCLEIHFVGTIDYPNRVANGSFESDVLFSSYRIGLPGSPTLQNWNIEGAGIVHTGSYWQASDGNQSVELNYFASGGISQEISIIPGERYFLAFDIAGEPEMRDPIKQLQISWNNELLRIVSFDTTGHNRGNMGWRQIAFALPVLDSHTALLKFFGSTPSIGNGGVAIDNIVIDTLDSSNVVVIPETSNLCLSAISLLGFAFGLVRTRNRIAHVNS